MNVTVEDRRYRLKHKVTGKYFNGYEYKRKKGRGSTLFAFPIYSDYTPGFLITQLNTVIKNIISINFFEILDECEIETVQVQLVPIKGTIRLKHIRNRLEQEEIMKRLKNA